MLPTFVIGLREGLEAALIVGIIAAFLTRNGDRRSLRLMWLGVFGAVAFSFGLAAVIQVTNHRASFRTRELIEGALTLVAVAGVSYMILWMKHHAGELREELETKASAAIAGRSALALIATAFFAVIREGIETAIFLIAAFAQSNNPQAAGTGAILGVALAVAIGLGVYRGGLRFDLRRFFRVTGILLVFIAAGLVSSAVHEFTEAGFITFGTTPAINLSTLIPPGTLRGGLLGAFLGLEPVPTYVEVCSWFTFFIPMVWLTTRTPRTAVVA